MSIRIDPIRPLQFAAGVSGGAPTTTVSSKSPIELMRRILRRVAGEQKQQVTMRGRTGRIAVEALESTLVGTTFASLPGTSLRA